MTTTPPFGRATAVLSAIVALSASGCGGSAPHAAPAPRAASTTAAQPASSTPRSAASATARCEQSAGGDPASFSICLARHHVRLPDGGKLTTCVQSASSKADLTACLAQAAG